MSKNKWQQYKSETNQKKKTMIGFRVTDNERKKIKRLAAERELLLSEYILSRTVYAENENIIALKKDLNDAIFALSKVGVNLNQAAYCLNVSIKNSETNYKISSKKCKEGLQIISDNREELGRCLRQISILLSKLYKL